MRLRPRHAITHEVLKSPDLHKNKLKKRRQEKIERRLQSGTKIVQYWDNQPASVDGVLGGYKKVDQIDILTSRQMLVDANDHISGYNSALDCGAGIGRIAKQILVGRFRHIDLMEPSSIQIEEAKRLLSNEVRSFI